MTVLISVLAALALAATAVVASVPAASAAVKTAGHPAARAAVKPGNSVEVPAAMADLATARRDHRKVEVAADRTAFSRTFANPDGTLTTSVSQRPRWVRRGTAWVAASADLTRNASGTWSPKAAQAGLQLSGGGSKALATLSSGGRSMSLSWPSVLPAPQVNGPQATYASVFPGVDLVVTAQVSGGFTETLVVHNASAARDPQLRNLTLGVSLSKGLAQKAGKDGAVTVQTAGGQAVFTSPAPVAWDSARPSGSPAASTVTGPARGAHVATVNASYRAGSVSMSVPSSLTGSSAVFPVFVDPSYSQTQAWEGYGELQSAYPATNELNSTYDGKVSVGYDGAGVDRGNYVFGLPPLPTGLTATVSSATITGEVVATQTAASESHTVNAYYTSQYTSASTWNSPPSQLAGPVAATFTTASTTPDLNVSWTVTSWLQTALNNGSFQVSAELINANETSNLLFAEFGPNPTLTYTYSQPAPSIPLGSGPVMNATQLKFPVSDKAALKVNVGSGNALVTTSDIAIPEQGSSLTLGVAYNSLLTGSQVMTGSDGVGWRQREGADVRLYLGSDGSLTYLGEDGVAGKFAASGSNWTSPPQFHATLAISTTACGGTGYTMRWRRTGQVMCFNANGLLTSQADRNGNTTAYSYNSSSQETQITYTPKGASSPNETVTATYAGSYLNTLSESGGSLGTRTVTYTVNANGDLQSVKQADLTLLQFGYDSSHDLTSIENGASVTTHLGYDSSHRVTSVGQTYGSCGCTATTRLSYVSSTETQVADPNTNQSQAVSAVPNTTYTLNSQDLVTTTVDQQNNTFKASYNGQDDQTGTSNADGGSTISSWTAAHDGVDENLTQSQSAMGATTKAQYTNTDTAANPTAEYQPSTSTDAQNNATAYTYDGAGNMLQSADALPATAKVTYNSDGSPATSTDPKNGTNSTSYTYNALHQLTKVTPPTGNSLAASTLTYDGYGRTATITDGDGNTVTYTYDNADRITKQAYTGGTHTVTVTYVYDGAGNLKTQTDPSGTTSWTYDGRNKVLTKNATSGGGTLTYDYDADSNLAKATDAGGTTTYTYDTRNLLSSLTDPASNLWQFAYNADGLRTTTWFATSTGNTTWAEKMVTSYDKGDRITRIQTYRASSASNVVSDVSYCYSPYVSGQACPTVSSTSTDKALLQWSENNQTSTISQYTYDAGDRLKTATNYGGTNYSYGYDTDGNLTSGGTAGAQTFNSANQVTNTGYTYDGAGNTTTTPGLGTLTYNDAEQWTAGSTTGESFSYAGAGMNQVLSDGSATGITYGLAGQAGQAWVQSYTPTSSATDYVIHDQQGTPLGYVQSGTAYGFGTDNLGSVTNVVASNGTTVATYANTPWGHQNSATGTDAAQNLIRYAGALFDPTSSNYSTFGARWYNAYTGAFTTQDASGNLSDPENGNRYAYASDNPANYTDPTGRFSLDDIAGGLIGAAAALTAAITLPVTGPLLAVTIGIVALTSVGSGIFLGCGITSLSSCPQP